MVRSFKLLAVTLLIASTVPRIGCSQEVQQTPQVETESKSNSALESQQKPGADAQPTPPAAASTPHVIPHAANNESQGETNKSEEEGTEFWPPFRGYRIKITDSLLALFTFLLFIATWLLWRATRNLVLGAENTAERQLRAYIFGRPDTVELHLAKNLQGGDITIQYEILNTGQTPAYDVDNISEVRIMPWPLPNDFVIEPVKDESGSGHNAPIGPNQRGAFSRATGKYRPLRKNEGFYLLVVIKYRDAFKKPRTTLMCYSPDISPLLAGAGPGQIRKADALHFRICTRHNEAD